MKKITFIMTMVVAVSIASCTAQSPKPSLKNDIDTLSYAFGMARTQGLSEYLLELGIDSTQQNNFVKGFLEGARHLEKSDIAYAAGLQIGQNVAKSWVESLNKQLFSADSTKSVNLNDMLAGFVAGYTGKGGVMDRNTATTVSDVQMQQLQQANTELLYAPNREAGEKFLEENKTKEGVQITASGLQYKVLQQGNGPVPTKDQRVKVLYTGKLLDGTVFDSTSNRNDEPAVFGVGQVISGWTEALQMMPVGSKWELYIPYDLAYGTNGTGNSIEPYSTLIFEVELLDIEK